MVVPAEARTARERNGSILGSLWQDASSVLTAPSRGFYRLAEGGRWLPPVILAGLFGLCGSGADALKAVIIAALGGGWEASWLAKTAGLFALLFPLYYAGSIAVYALVGAVMTGRDTGIGFRQAFRRCWAAVGWVHLPALLLMLVVTGLIVTVFKPGLSAALARVPPGTSPSFAFSTPIVIALGVTAWVAWLFLVAIRQAFAASTGRAVAIIAVSGILFGGLVQTPVARLVIAQYTDTRQALGCGPARVTVSSLAYRFVEDRLPARGDLVAYGPPGANERPAFVLNALGFTAVGLGGYGEAEFGRVVGLPGDNVAVRNGQLIVNGNPVEESYLNGLDPAVAFPPGLSLAETTVGPGLLLILPDNRTLVSGPSAVAAPLVAVTEVLGKVIVVGVSPVRIGASGKLRVRASDLPVVGNGDPRVFALYCGLNLAGYDEEFGAAMHPVRQRVRGALAPVDPREFEAFRAILSRSGPWQLQGVVLKEVGPPPGFSPGPGSGALAAELSGALASFWRARGEALWQEYGPAHEEFAASLVGPARDAIQATLAYCREDYSPATSVTVVPNLLASAKTASLQFDEATGTAYVLVGPGEGLPLNAVVHEFCHRIVGQAVSHLEEVGDLERFRPVLDRAVAGKTVASQSYASLRSYVEDCLVRALTIRIRPDDKIEERLDREYGWGFFLVRPFWEALGPYETADQKLTDCLPGVFEGVDVNALLREVEPQPPTGS